MTTIVERETGFITDFNELDDWLLQYEYLLELTSFMAPLTEAEKCEANRVPGCQSNVWLVPERAGDIVRVRAHSDSLIIRGVLAVLVDLLDGRLTAEVIAYDMRFIEQTALKAQLSSDRFKGMAAVLQRIKDFAAL